MDEGSILAFRVRGPKVLVLFADTVYSLPTVLSEDLEKTQYRHLILENSIIVLQSGILRRISKDRIIAEDGIGRLLYG